MADLFRAEALPLAKIVVCTQGQWTNHIIVQHMALIGHEADVEEAVHDPDLITQDRGFSRRRGFYKFNLNLDPLSPHLKVVIEIPVIGRASVVTAYETNKVKAGEAILWQR